MGLRHQMPVATAAPEEGLPDRRKSMTDPRFEFDAPRYYDFARGSPESGSRPDDWFSDARATAGAWTRQGRGAWLSLVSQ